MVIIPPSTNFAGPCCPSKTMDGVNYILSSEEDTSLYNCIDECVYHQEDASERKYCFTKGDKEVSCKEGNMNISM